MSSDDEQGQAGITPYQWLLYILALVSAILGLVVYGGAIDEQLDRALIPQSITVPCSLFFVFMALIFIAMGVAEGLPGEAPASQNHK